MTVALATVVHDPADKLLPKIDALLAGVAGVFDGIGVLASRDATAATLRRFDACGAVIHHDRGATGLATIGRGRRSSLGAALETGATHVLYSDVDHVLRWFERHGDHLRETLAALDDADFTVIGRTPESFDRAPAPLRETEGLCNRFYEQLTGRRWELFIALRGMSAPTAALIVDGCDEDTIATDVAWPLFVEAHGGSLAYREAPVDYETSTWYVSAASEREGIERDPRAWALRFELGRQMFDAFARWGPG